jgi:hypothetical protein
MPVAAAVAGRVLSALVVVLASWAESRAGEPGRGAQPVVERVAEGRATRVRVGGTELRTTLRRVENARVVAVPGSAAAVVLWDEVPADGGEAEAWYAASLDGAAFAPAQPARHGLMLKRARFDPGRGAGPALDESLRARAGSTLRIVQFETPPLEAYRAAVEAAGARVLAYIPNNAYLARMDGRAAAAVGAMAFVRSVVPMHPAWKAEPELLEEPAATVNIQVAERGPGMKAAVAARIRALGGTVEEAIPEGFLLRATLTRAQLAEVLRLDEVVWTDRWGPSGVDMDKARQISGATFVQSTLGFTGQGVRGEVMDDNLLTTHVDFQSPAPMIHGSRSGPTDHGTCCYGIVFGKGVGQATGRGLLPGAEQGIFGDKDLMTNRYAHTAELVDPAGPYRAVFQSNSWGSPWTTTYTSVSAQMDDILFLHDIVVTQSMSNNGNQLARPEAWAKNIIACGGIEHYDTLSRTDDRWNGFASIGPASDGRIKPDLSHFADSIFCPFDTSTTSYITSFNGTSSATAITAGYVGLLMQMWHEGVFPGFGGVGATVFADRMRSSTARALLINTAYQYPFSGASHDLARTHQGWGMVDLENLYNQRHGMLIVDATEPLAPLATRRYTVSVPAGSTLRATLVYPDPAGNPAASVARVNDLSLKLTSPGGVEYWGNAGLLTGNWSTAGGSRNTVDTVENVFIQSAQGGTWFVDVSADEINQDGYAATPELDAVYSLVVSGLTPCAPPAITAQPGSLTRCAGVSATFSVTATGATGYQWRKNAVDIPGATGSSYTIASPAAEDAGSYTCVVSNTCGTTTSSAATLTVNVAPAIASHPASVTPCPGSSVTFTVTATGTPAPTYQWQKNGANISGATSPSYTISSVASGSAGTYRCVVTNSCGSATSDGAVLTVGVAPSITTQPANVTACAGGPATFTIVATGTPAPSYQWQKGGVDIPGANAAAFTIDPVSSADAGTYRCIVTNACGSVTSSNRTLTVNVGAAITSQPVSLERCPGTSASFSVTATGTPSPTYQWQKNGVNISGATSATYTISSVAAANAGAYRCVVTNSCATVTSLEADLVVNAAPTITTQPSGQTVCSGTAVTLSVAATGTPAPSYQWQKNTVNIPGATSATLVLDPVATGDAGTYRCVVSNTCGTVNSSNATLTVNATPSITTHPASQAVCAGGPVTFSVVASGSPTYQWRKNGVNISGATSASYGIGAVSTGDAATYDCIVSNGTCSTTSNAATLTVNVGPAITSQPASLARCPGQSATFTVSATGSPAPSYQWRKNGVDIPGATSAAYTIASPAAGDAGSYDCVVTNACGAATSTAATLTVQAGPSITGQPGDLARCPGQSATFTVSATGSPAPTFQWRKDGVDIPGATSAAYTIASPAAGDAGSYDCVVTNACGTATSAAATLTVQAGPSITGQPADLARCPGQSATFTVTASGSPTPTFQWRKDGADIPGATSAAYTIASPAAGDAGSYDCVVTNACGTATSTAATLTVQAGPSITGQPADLARCPGQSATFTVSATGSPAPTFQWRRNGADIPGATASAYTIASPAAGDAGSYDCVVTNACGTATSAAATLTVNVLPFIVTDPAPQSACPGGSVTFTVTAAGVPAPSLQWRRNGSPIAGATGPALTIDPVSAADAGSYDCVVTNACGTATSAAAALAVGSAPVVTQPPSPVSACAGGQATFTVVATGTAPLAYQWRRNGADLPGQTAAALVLPAVSQADAGEYSVAVSNACGTTTSAAAALTVGDQPQVAAGPESVTVASGQPATFTVSATGAPPLTYAWRHNGEAISDDGNYSGAASATLTVNPARLSAAGTYDVVVGSACGEVISPGATLTVLCRPDWNGDQTLTPSDVAGFVAAWQASLVAGTLEADYDGDGDVDPADIAVFVAEWFAAVGGGC